MGSPAPGEVRVKVQYLLFPLFIPLERSGAPCLLGLVQQKLGCSLFLFERVDFIIQGLLLLLQLLFLVLVKLLQTVKLLVQLCSIERKQHFVVNRFRADNIYMCIAVDVSKENQR